MRQRGQLLIAAVYSHERLQGALKWIHQSPDLETMSLVSHIYLSMNRVDLARKQVGLMQQQDDDRTPNATRERVGVDGGRWRQGAGRAV